MNARIVFALACLLGSTTACSVQVTGGDGGGGGETNAATTGTGSTSTEGTGGGATGPGCATSADCADGDVCSFAIAAACSAAGVCLPKPVPEACNAIGIEKACSCDGGDVAWTIGCAPDLPNGYAPVPIAHTGPCTDVTPCTTSDDCTAANGYTPPSGFTRGECAYPVADGCAAQGQCVDPFPMCDSDVDVVACGCDGTRIDMYCGYPAHEYAPKPLDHYGPCVAQDPPTPAN
ncbi:MAG TPA: hypothetical protein VGM56_24240 [Byssovorax sp.]|jgi:hypothetical protein